MASRFRPSTKNIRRLMTMIFTIVLSLGSAIGGQAQDKIVKPLVKSNEPVEIRDLKLKGVARILGQKFLDDEDDWFRGLKIKVKNRSGKSIVYLQVHLIFDRPDDPAATQNTPFGYFLSYGSDPRLSNNPVTANMPEAIVPDSIKELGLTEGNYNDLKEAFKQLKYTTKVNKIRLVLGLVAFDDGTAWYGGRWFRRNPDKNPNDPDGYVPMEQQIGRALTRPADFFKASLNISPITASLPFYNRASIKPQTVQVTGICSILGFPRLYSCISTPS